MMIIFIHTTMCSDRQTDRPKENNTINTAVLSCVAVVCLLYYRILCHFRSGLSATEINKYGIVL